MLCPRRRHSRSAQDPVSWLTRSNYLSSSTRLAKAMTITNVHCGTLVSSNDSLGQVAETLYQGSFGPRPLCTSPVPPCNPPRFRQIRVSAVIQCSASCIPALSLFSSRDVLGKPSARLQFKRVAYHQASPSLLALGRLVSNRALFQPIHVSGLKGG
ncbi:hypothetical protein CMEL01_08738 [Colletotrichum melonis]|uniref:Uncharacterized protein n=1 Tax=Colletotrichum melonis TaxID=1209925 RepID=A0AAI9U2Z7_9PEZI|nr:hypothetical protein CMEL01_08738 [Colletotrichum melonis]